MHLIATTTTAKGLTVTCRLDRRRYPAGGRVSDAEIAAVNLTPHQIHGEWNCSIRPHLAKVKGLFSDDPVPDTSDLRRNARAV